MQKSKQEATKLYTFQKKKKKKKKAENVPSTSPLNTCLLQFQIKVILLCPDSRGPDLVTCSRCSILEPA